MERTARVFILYTGGTIGMAPRDLSDPASPLVPHPFADLKGYMPGLEYLEIAFGETSFDPPLDSSHITPAHWLEIAGIIHRVYHDYDGFVILHGTDTMAYTASALSFLFENLGKPVVLTGSQRPISHPETDGVHNLLHAVEIAGYKASGLPLVPEVVLCFGDKLLRGCRATKVSVDHLAGFDSPDQPPLGRIGETIWIDRERLRPPPAPEAPFSFRNRLETGVFHLPLFPGIDPRYLELLFREETLKGIVISSFGAGNAPGDPAFLEAIGQAVRRGKTILNVTQCMEGKVAMGRYASGSELERRGVIGGLDLTVEAALTKLMWVLGFPREEQAGLLAGSWRGEQ